MENSTTIINSAALFLTVAYGLSFGIKNWALRIWSWSVPGRTFNIGEKGRFYDYMFFTSLLYFGLFQKRFIIETLKTAFWGITGA